MLKRFIGTALIAHLVLLPLAVFATGPQDSPPDTPTFRANVRQVLVPVVVTDPKGHYVANLNASDFTVLEDGVPQDVVAVSSSTDPAGASLVRNGPVLREATPSLTGVAEAFRADAAGVQRSYILCLDTLHSSFSNFGSARDSIAKVLAHEDSDGSRYAIVTLGAEIKVAQQFTTDTSQIAAVARSKSFADAMRESETTSDAVLIQQFRNVMQGYCTNCACSAGGRSADDPACNLYRGQVRGALVSFGQRQSVLSRSFLVQLTELVNNVATLPGSRTIVLISDGFNRFPGRELYAVMQAYGPKDFSLYSSSPPDTGPEMDSLLRLATKYNIAFYTLDARGVYSSISIPGSSQDASASTPSGGLGDMGSSPAQTLNAARTASDRQLMVVAHENTDGMALLARATGGLFFENNNDLAKGLRTALEDGRRHYVLAYVSRNQTPDGKYRKIDVEVKGSKKLRVNAKAGYWADTNDDVIRR